jgi:hypothetical protein
MRSLAGDLTMFGGISMLICLDTCCRLPGAAPSSALPGRLLDVTREVAEISDR